MSKGKTHKQLFLETLNKFSGKHNQREVWHDFLLISAISFSNACDFKEKREELFSSTFEKYDEKDKKNLASLLFITIFALNENPAQDFLGEIYCSSHFSQRHLGQVFTPYHIADAMAKMTCSSKEDVEQAIKEKGYFSISDPSCGAGCMLIAAANNLTDMGIAPEKFFMVGQDIDSESVMMTYIQLTILDISAIVICGNTLTHPGICEENEIWYTPTFIESFQKEVV